eukprot:ctg_3514.g595
MTVAVHVREQIRQRRQHIIVHRQHVVTIRIAVVRLIGAVPPQRRHTRRLTPPQSLPTPFQLGVVPQHLAAERLAKVERLNHRVGVARRGAASGGVSTARPRQRQGHPGLRFRSRAHVSLRRHRLPRPPVPERVAHPACGHFQPGARHLRLSGHGQHRQDRLPGGAGGAGVQLVIPAPVRRQRPSAVPHPVRHRPGPVLSHDPRRGAAARLPQTGAHPQQVLPGAARTPGQDERQHTRLGDLRDRLGGGHPQESEQVRVQRRPRHRRRAPPARRRLRPRHRLSVLDLFSGRRRAAGGYRRGVPLGPHAERRAQGRTHPCAAADGGAAPRGARRHHRGDGGAVHAGAPDGDMGRVSAFRVECERAPRHRPGDTTAAPAAPTNGRRGRPRSSADAVRGRRRPGTSAVLAGGASPRGRRGVDGVGADALVQTTSGGVREQPRGKRRIQSSVAARRSDRPAIAAPFRPCRPPP